MTHTTEIYLIRHGETTYNAKRMVQGRGIDAPLNEKGEWQAQQFYEAYKNVPFDIIYVSALQRTQQSVQAFIDDGIPFEKRADLDEISWGAQEGMPPSEAAKQRYEKLINDWSAGNFDAKIEGGESLNDIVERQRRFLAELKQTAAKTVLIACHGRAIRSLLCLMLNEPLTDVQGYAHQNLGLYRLQLTDGEFKMIRANDVRHLK